MGRREAAAAGIDEVYSLAGALGEREGLGNPAASVRRVAATMAKAWSTASERWCGTGVSPWGIGYRASTDAHSDVGGREWPPAPPALSSTADRRRSPAMTVQTTPPWPRTRVPPPGRITHRHRGHQGQDPAGAGGSFRPGVADRRSARRMFGSALPALLRRPQPRR